MKVTPSVPAAVLAVCLAGTSLAAEGPEKVAIRVGGRFLRVAEQGNVRPDRLVPGGSEMFQLIARGKDQIALRAPGGRLVVPAGGDGRLLRASSFPLQPGPQETFRLVPVGENRFALGLLGRQGFVVVDPAAAKPPSAKPPSAKPGPGPGPREIVEIYRLDEVPAAIRTALLAGLTGLATEELRDKEYDKTRTHKIEKYVDLPAPTWDDLTRTKRRQVVGMVEEYRLQAALDGKMDIRVPQMPYLRPYGPSGPGLLLVAVEARLPVHGRVRYRLADVLSGSTGYWTTVQLRAVAEVTARRSGVDVVLSPPRILDLNVSLAKLVLSNDLLDAVRRQVEQVINRELRQNVEHIRQKANRSLEKATGGREFRLPFAGYLGLL